MTTFIKFIGDDAGAITIDWTALTAGVLVLGILIVYSIFNDGVSVLVTSVTETLSTVSSNVAIPDPDNFE